MSPIEMMVDAACVASAVDQFYGCTTASDDVIMAWIAEGYTIDETISGILDGELVLHESRIVFDGTRARVK